MGTSSWLPHGYSAGMDGVSSGRYHGCHMDALWEWMKSHLDVIMVGTWMLCRNGWSLWERYQGCHMDALREWISLWERYHDCHMDALWEWIEFVGTSSWLPHGYSAGMDGVSSGRYHGCHMDALWEWMKSHLDVIMVGTWMLCRNGWSLWERYQGCHMDALREWIEFVGTLSWLPHG